MRRLRLLTLITLLTIGTLAHTTAQAQSPEVMPTASSTQPTALADDKCQQQLLKVLDTLDKAERVIKAQGDEITALKDLDKTRLAQIAARDELITFYSKQLHKTKWQKAFEKIEKYGIFAAGIYIGSGL